MNSPSQLLDELFVKKRWLIHGLFWLLILFIYGIFFGRKNNNYNQTIFFVGLLMPVTVVTTYFFNYWLIPRYLLRGKYLVFIIYSCYTLIASLFLEMLVALLTFLIMAQLNIAKMSPASVDIFFLLASLLMVVFFAIAIKILLHWRQSKEDYQKLQMERMETELKFLKLQLNPHFLFNTLNNLYYLATQKSERTPQAILQLSEMLDYVMHSGKHMLIVLTEELKQVDNYIVLEMLRYEDRVQISKEFSGDFSAIQVPPMVLITLIENAFKHGVMPSVGMSWIKLMVILHDNELTIGVCNSTIAGGSSQGIGLQNLRGQLNFLYGENYKLITTYEQGEFNVILTLILTE
jgi:sensor histidine kinase YesM